MKNADPVQDELDQIRRAIYKEIKHMTPSQITEYYRRRTEPIIRQFGMKVVTSAYPTARRARPRGRVPRLATP